MKKIIPVFILVFIQYFVVGQSPIEKVSHSNTISNTAFQSSSIPESKANTVNSSSNYQTQSVTPNYNQNVVQYNSNSNLNSNPNFNIVNNQNVVSHSNSRISLNPKTSFVQKLAIISDFYPVIRKIVFPNGKPEKKELSVSSNILFSSLSDSGYVYYKPTIKVPLNLNDLNKGTTTFINTDSNFFNTDSNTKSILHYKYKCVYGNYASYYGSGFYSIHVASFKNLNYIKTVIRYMKSRYKLDVFVFYDLSSVNMRYHLVIGKYRQYFVADNILRIVRKEMPNAFVINWSQYSWMILFQ